MFGVLTELTGHWDDFALERTFCDIPLSLVDHERRLAVLARVRVCFHDEPGGDVRDALERGWARVSMAVSREGMRGGRTR